MLLKHLINRNLNEDVDTVKFHIDNEKAYTHVMDKFGHVIGWNNDTMTAPRKYWSSIQELAYAAGGEAEEEENISSAEEGPIEAYGYAYNPQDRRVNWRKEFKNGEAAYAWAEKKNATILGTRPIGVNEGTLEESASLETTLRNIINDIGEPVTGLYDQLKFMAKKYVHDHGELDRGWKMVAQGAGARWVQSFYDGRLKNELYHLTRYNTKNTAELQQFLRGREVNGKLELKRSFFKIADELPAILEKIGNKLNVPQLAKNAARWQQNSHSYSNYLDSLGDTDTSDPEDENRSARRAADKDSKHTTGKQFDQIEQIVNSVLSKLPSKIAGDIRNAIARSPNKLQALQIELQKRSIQLSENEADYGPEFQAKVARLKQMAKQGERKTVWDPVKRVYKTVPVNPPKEQGVAEDATRSEAQASYMQGQCMILAVAINQYNPQRYPVGYIWEYNVQGIPDMQLDDDEWQDLTPEEQQAVSNDPDRRSLVHAFVYDQVTKEYIDARGRHRDLPNLWGKGVTRFEKFPGSARELIDITAHGEWDDAAEEVSFKRGRAAFDSVSGPAGVKKALDYAIKYLGVVGPESAGAEGVAETLPMHDAVKVLRQYGADNFKTTSNELHFYKQGRPFSVDLIWGNEGERSVNLSQLNSATRQLKGQGVAEGKKPEHNLGTGWMLDKDKQLGQKVAQNKAKARQEKDTLQKYAGKKVGEEKKKGADGKACWKGYRYAGTENGKDKCIPVGEDIENIMGALIESIIKK
jgi:hypothetical protein